MLPPPIIRPLDATLTVTKAAHLLGVHPNTIRAWSDAGRLRYYRINARGDRRYRVGDLQRFLAAAEIRPHPTALPGLRTPFGRTLPPGPRRGGERWTTGNHRPRGPEVDRLLTADAAAEARWSPDTDSATAPGASATGSAGSAAQDPPGPVPPVDDHHVSTPDFQAVLEGLVDRAMGRFEADRAAVFLCRPGGRLEAVLARGLSPAYLAAVGAWPARSLPAVAATSRAPVAVSGYADDPLSLPLRAAVAGEPFDTACSVPLVAGAELVGFLDLYHDRRRRWEDADLAALAGLAEAASGAVRTARDHVRMATWTAQLQSIQQLGARLSRLTGVDEIGVAIAAELRSLIGGHRARVERLVDGHLVALATTAAAGEPEAHALPTLVGEGITGWVAAERVAQNLPDVARDPRAGAGEPTDAPRPDESMLVAPMLHGDRVVGVLSLAKPGLQQFGDDELRLLTIFASFAAQALSNAEATERLQRQAAALERQLRSQRELLGVTESILTMLEPREIIERIAERLGEVVAYDNISIEVYDRAERRLRPVTARGVHAADYLVEWEPGEVGLATWVVENDEPVLVEDQAADPRVRHFASTGPIHGSLIVVPLHDRDGTTGVLTVERLDPGDVFGDDEFELVKLFAGQVSIALQNAEVYRAVDVRARTDDLTRLLNRGTFEERLRRSVAEGDTFSLILLDLDGFREVNNVLGHQAGDRFLRDVAAALRSAGRETDLAFRYGGDEFCYLLPGSDEAGARHVAERVLKAVAAISEPGTAWAAARARVTASVGWATHPVDGCTADELLLAADRATYVAKRRGGNRIATAEEGLALAAEVRLQEPTPVDPPSLPAA